MLSRAVRLGSAVRFAHSVPGPSTSCEQCLAQRVLKNPLSPGPSSAFLARRYASTQTGPILPVRKDPRSPKPPSHKPPKRRLEAASQPLRNAPSSTRGPVLQCVAHTTAERYDLTNLGYALKGLGVRWDEVPEGDRDRAIVIGPWKGRGGAERLISGKDVRRTTWTANAGTANTGLEEEDIEEESREPGFGYGDRGEIWVFNNGSFVTWGLTEEEGRAFLREVIRRKGAGVERGVLGTSEYEVEEVDFVVDPTAQTHILGNLILLGAPPILSTFHPSLSLASLLARYTLSLALTRSSQLSVLEDRLDAHIASVSTLPLALSRYGAQPMNRRDVIRKIGELMALRMAVNTSGGGLDETPEFYWSEPALEEYFDSITREFEIKERIESINKKIDYAQEIQSTLRALLTEASGHRMEIIIIALIAVEVVLALIREGPELKESVIMPAIGYIGHMLGIKSMMPERTQEDTLTGNHGHHGWRLPARDKPEPLLTGELAHTGRQTQQEDWSWTRSMEGLSHNHQGPRLV